mmetsp:Transcript_11330/g.13384  ORF Transcript_11330/g.13384 Transcript_11330/m.13384 type:complete len:84 (-) Transcript_11330:461-712(-)
MNTNQIGNGIFVKNHPRFTNMEWWGLSHIDKDKRRRLGVHNPNVREIEDDLGRFPRVFIEESIKIILHYVRMHISKKIRFVIA